MKKRKSRVIVMLVLMLMAVMVPLEASAATKTTAKYNSRPADQYAVWFAGTAAYDGFQYEHFINVKTKKANKKIKLIETKGGKIGCYKGDANHKVYKAHDRNNKSTNYSGKIQYWVYEGSSASGKVISTGTSIFDHSEYIKLPKANKNYTVKVRFYINKKPHMTDGVGAALRYVGGKYPKWYLRYDTGNFYTPAVRSKAFYPNN